MSLAHLPRDAPFPASELDNVRVTVIYDTNGRCTQQTDDGTCTTPPCDSSWTGVTVFQIKGHVRKEYAMYVKEPLVGARQMGKITEQRHAKAFKKDKNNLTERAMTPEERAQFKAAKVKELQSFFDNQVWAFETTKEAEPSRTLTSRMLLKWSKNPDGQGAAHCPWLHGPRCLGGHRAHFVTHNDEVVQIHAVEPGRQHEMASLDVRHRHCISSGQASKQKVMGTTPCRMS